MGKTLLAFAGSFPTHRNTVLETDMGVTPDTICALLTSMINQVCDPLQFLGG